MNPECSSTLTFAPTMSRLNPVHASTLCFHNQLHHTFRLVDISVFSGTCLAMSRWLFRFTDAMCCSVCFNPLTPNDPYAGRTAPLTSKRCILYIYSTNVSTECFKHGIYSPSFSLQKCSLFYNPNIFGSCIIHILYTGCAKIKKNNSGAKRLNSSIV